MTELRLNSHWRAVESGDAWTLQKLASTKGPIWVDVARSKTSEGLRRLVAAEGIEVGPRTVTMLHELPTLPGRKTA